jgi:Tol biopolymer transport system component
MISEKIPSFGRNRLAPRRRSGTRASLEALEGRRLLAVTLVSGGGTPGPGTGGALEPSVSADGNFVAFSSDFSYSATDTNGLRDVYLYDKTQNTVILVSRTPTGSAGNAASSEPSISQDGAFVSFSSTATDLAGGQPAGNGQKDIFIWERATGTLTQVSVTTGGGNPGAFSAEPNTNGDGNFVAYTSPSDAASLDATAADVNTLRDVFLWNRTTGVTRLVSTTTSGTTGPFATANAGSFDPSVSADGRFVAFRSEATDLVAGVDTNTFRDIYLRDMTTGATILVSRTSAGTSGNSDSDSPSVSSDGNFVVFSSLASNLVQGDTSANGRDIYLFNRTDNSVTLVSRNVNRTGSGDKDSSEPSISQDGRFIAFTSEADDLVTGDTNGVADIFLYDIETGAMNRISVNETTGEQGNGASTDANVAPGGRFVAFTSAATNLAAGDTNGAVNDAFVGGAPNRDPGTTNPPTATIVPGNQPPATLGSPFLQFTVTYSDDVDLAPASFDGGDITVTPPGGAPLPVQFVGISGGGTSANVTYQIAAPGGVLDEADNGAYTINVVGGQVADANGNFVAAGPLTPVTVTVTAASGPDLVPSFPEAVPPAVGLSKAKVRVLVANQGDQPTPKGARMTLALYLSADGTVDANDVLVGQVTKKLKLRPQQAKRFTVKGVYNTPAGGPDYQLLAVADSTGAIPESREFNNTAATAVNVQPAFVDLRTTVGAPTRPTAIAGRPFVLPVTVENLGNVAAKGTATYTVVASTDDVLGNADDVLVTTTPITKRLSVKNAKTKRVPLKFTAPVAGSYRFFVTTTFTGDTLADTNTGNDTDSGDAPVTVA